jgi:hypothetical protein
MSNISKSLTLAMGLGVTLISPAVAGSTPGPTMGGDIYSGLVAVALVGAAFLTIRYFRRRAH